MKYVFCVLSLILSVGVLADNPVSGTISVIAANPESNTEHVGAGYTEFQITGMALDAPCTWLNLQSNDNAAISMLLSAQAQGKSIKVYYSTSLPSPWAAASCGVTNIQIRN